MKPSPRRRGLEAPPAVHPAPASGRHGAPRLLVRRIDEQEFAGMAPAWNALLARSRANTLFLTWEWLHTWWQCFKGTRSLLILSIWDEDGALVGIAPLCISRERLLEFIPVKTVHFMGVERVSSEYLDFILHPDQEAAAIEAVVSYLEAHADLWDRIFLSDMRESACTLDMLRAALAGRRLPALVRASEVCPYIALPDSYEAYLKTLSKNMRYHVGRRTRALQKAGTVRLVECQDEAQLDTALHRLFDLHEARWQTRGRAGNFRHPAVRQFHAQLVPLLLEKGWLRFRFLTVNGDAVAVLYGFEYGGTYAYYQSGFDPEWARWSVGAVLMGLGIENAIKRGLTEFDYLRGDEPYKRKWTHTYRRTLVVSIYRRRLTSQLVLGRDRARTLARRVLARWRAWRRRRLLSGAEEA